MCCLRPVHHLAADAGCVSSAQGIKAGKLDLPLAEEVPAVVATQPQPDPGALSIAPADGYQYGDDHPWTGADQTRLAKRLDNLMADLPDPT